MNDKKIMDLLKKTLSILKENPGLLKKAEEKKLVTEIENVIRQDEKELDDMFVNILSSVYPGIRHC